jgi:hypothetical protein
MHVNNMVGVLTLKTAEEAEVRYLRATPLRHRVRNVHDDQWR